MNIISVYVRPIHRITFGKARKKAEREGKSLSQVISELLEEYVKTK